MLVKVFLNSVPGMYAQYSRTVIVNLNSEDLDDDFNDIIFHKAVRRLRNEEFPDRSASMWRMLGWEKV